MDSTLYPPFEQLSPTNRGPIVSVFIFICLTTTCIIVLAKLLSSLYFKQRQHSVNTPIWFALLFALIQSILMQIGVDHGLGRHKLSLSPSRLDKYQKLVYTSEILLVAILFLSKISTALLVQKISPKNNIRTASWVAMGLTGVWALMATLGNALQCGFPNPWACPGKLPLQYVIGIFNIVTDVVIVGIPAFMLQSVQIPLEKRLRIEVAFAVRLLIPVVTIVQMAFLSSYIDSEDYTWTVVNTAVCKQFMMNISIIAACTPTLYHVISGFSAGLVDLHIPENMELSTQSHSKHTQSNSRSDKLIGPSQKPDDKASRPPHSQFGTLDDPWTYGLQTQVRASSESTESTRHLTKADSHGVMKTVDVWVDVETRGDAGSR